MHKVTLDLECKLTSKELQDKGQQMASAILEYDDFEEEKKSQAKELGDKMKELHLKLSRLGKIVKNKLERRPVECEVRLNTPQDGTKRIVRLDTKEILKELPMTVEECQTNLFSDSIEELNKMFELPSEPPPDQPAA